MSKNIQLPVDNKVNRTIELLNKKNIQKTAELQSVLKKEIHESIQHSSNIENLPKEIYHYTSFETFLKIVEYGTLRFKLSTESNDTLDTKYFSNIFKEVYDEMRSNANDDNNKLYDFVKYLIDNDSFEELGKSYVSCFSRKKDSRLFWDAYTINRQIKTRQEESSSYNGVCLCINTKSLLEVMNSNKNKVCHETKIEEVHYKKSDVVDVVSSAFNYGNEVYCLTHTTTVPINN